MMVKREPFGQANGQPVERYILSGKGGLEAAVLTYGATIQALRFAGRDLVLGYDTLEGYQNAAGSYQGATIGRYANRIAEGRFMLNGVSYDVGCNEAGRGHLHGGVRGFDKKVWTAQVLDDGEEPAVRFSTEAADGEEGYPGRLQVSVTIRVTADNTLKLVYDAVSDRDTVFNPTNHAYFNLNGWDGGDVLDTQLTVYADAITLLDERLIPTGEILPVEGTVFDFRQGKAIGEAVLSSHPQIQIGGGIDQNFVLGMDCRPRHAAHAVSPRSGIAVDCTTDRPGLQVYTANGLKEQDGKGGIPLYRYQGFCLETQCFPDSPNHPEFPTTTLRAEEPFHSVTSYRFTQE